MVIRLYSVTAEPLDLMCLRLSHVSSVQCEFILTVLNMMGKVNYKVHEYQNMFIYIALSVVTKPCVRQDVLIILKLFEAMDNTDRGEHSPLVPTDHLVKGTNPNI